MILVEPGTARVLFANAAAYRLAGGALELGVPAEEYPRAYRLYDASGRALAPDEMPAVRAARGEPVQHMQVDWDTPDGLPDVARVRGDDHARGRSPGHRRDLRGRDFARRRAPAFLAARRRVAGDARQRRGRDHRPVTRPQADLRQRGRGAPLRDPEGHRALGLRRLDLPASATRPRTTLGRPLDLARLPGRLALAGLDPEPVVVRSRDRETGEVKWARIKATAVHDPDGGVRLAINVIEDITELKRSEEAQRFLAEASRRLSGSSLDYERTLAAVAELAVPALADSCVVDLVDVDGASAEAAEVMRTGAAWLEPSRVIVPMTAGRVIGTLTLSVDGAPLRLRRRAGRRGLRPARGRRGRERAALSRRLADRTHPADLAAAAGAARRAGRVAGGRVSPRRGGARSGGRLL